MRLNHCGIVGAEELQEEREGLDSELVVGSLVLKRITGRTPIALTPRASCRPGTMAETWSFREPGTELARSLRTAKAPVRTLMDLDLSFSCLANAATTLEPTPLRVLALGLPVISSRIGGGHTPPDSWQPRRSCASRRR